ncbi:hypothetical protein NJ76_23855 [Rhodococcus sp. IITR03]|nr:hypothetical protein NJ76_23855 [Rhodococcus sp. IITR03]
MADVADRSAVRAGSIAGPSDVRRTTGGVRPARGCRCSTSGYDAGGHGPIRGRTAAIGYTAAAGAAACVIVPSWAVTGSVVVAAAATLAILFTVAAASIMI